MKMASIVEEERGILVTDQDIEQDSLLKDSIKIRDPKSMPPLLDQIVAKKAVVFTLLGSVVWINGTITSVLETRGICTCIFKTDSAGVDGGTFLCHVERSLKDEKGHGWVLTHKVCDSVVFR